MSGRRLTIELEGPGSAGRLGDLIASAASGQPPGTVVVRGVPACAIDPVRNAYYRHRRLRPSDLDPPLKVDHPTAPGRSLRPLCWRCIARPGCGGLPDGCDWPVRPLEPRRLPAAGLGRLFRLLREAAGATDPQLPAHERAVVAEMARLRGRAAFPLEFSFARRRDGDLCYRYILTLFESLGEAGRAGRFMRRFLDRFCAPGAVERAWAKVHSGRGLPVLQHIAGIEAAGGRIVPKWYVRLSAPFSGPALDRLLPGNGGGRLAMIGFDLDPARGPVAVKYYLRAGRVPLAAISQEWLPERFRPGLPERLEDCYHVWRRRGGEQQARPYALDFDLLASGVAPPAFEAWLHKAGPPFPDPVAGLLSDPDRLVPARLSTGAGGGFNVYCLPGIRP